MVGKCPNCNKNLLERKSKKGKIYYSCEDFENCKFMSWDLPIDEQCEKCGCYMVKKETKNNIISMVEKIINNLPSYMLIAKIVGCVILLIIVLLIFLFWKSFKRAKSMLDSIRNVDTKELNKKLEEINLKLDKILSRNE